MKRLFLTAIIAAALPFAITATAERNVPFDMPEVQEPKIPDTKVTITDFGAKGDGMTLCTNAFRDAINSLSQRGGGRVVVPAGVWLTGPIVMKSNIDLHLEMGAIVQFSPDTTLYPMTEVIFEGMKAHKRLSPLSGTGLKNIAITGRGIFDGNGDFWRPLKKYKVTDDQWKNITTAQAGDESKNGTMWTPSGDRGYTRPNFLFLDRCEKIMLEDVTFKNSPAWNLHPLMCTDITLDNVKVLSPEYAQNSDGLDLESCKNVIVKDCTFDVGDDGICIKSGRDEEGRKRGMPTENVIVERCTVYGGHGGFVIGSEMSGGARNIYVHNCQFLGTGNGLRFKSTRGRGGVVEKIYIDNVSMAKIGGDAILFHLYYGVKRKPGEQIQPKPVDETTPSFRDIHISNLNCKGARYGINISGLPEMPVKNIWLKNVNITAKENNIMEYCEDIHQENVNVVVEK